MNRASMSKSPFLFFGLVFALSIPISLAGGPLGLELAPGVPVSAIVVTFCPLIAALILVYRERGAGGVVELLARAFDIRRIRAWAWYAPILLFMPAAMALEFGILRLAGSPVPAPQFTAVAVLVLFIASFIAALGEELGWMGYAIDPLQDRRGALPASLLLGLVWAAWHFIPLVQAGRSFEWIAWWSLATLGQRVLIVWLYNHTGKSVFAAALYHAMINTTWQLFPVNGSFYDPRITALIIAAAAATVTIVNGSIFKRWFYRNKRWLYRGNRPNWIAKVANRFWALVGSMSATSNGLVALEVIGRKSGRIVSFPLVLVTVDGERYLASMLGDNTQWVRNVRAAG